MVVAHSNILLSFGIFALSPPRRTAIALKLLHQVSAQTLHDECSLVQQMLSRYGCRYVAAQMAKIILTAEWGEVVRLAQRMGMTPKDAGRPLPMAKPETIEDRKRRYRQESEKAIREGRLA